MNESSLKYRPRRSAVGAAFGALLLAVFFVGGCGGGDAGAPDSRAVTSRITATEFVMQGAGADGTIIDVRAPHEFAEQHLTSARNINVQDATFRELVAPLDRSGRYYLYCRSGNRSGQAATIMSEMGFEDVVNIGGISDLVEAGAPAAR
jgi:phage shock protein E